MRHDTKTKIGEQPHSPIMAEINASKLKEAVSLSNDENDTIVNCYIRNSNALIDLLLDGEFKDHPHYSEILSAMFQQHTLLFLNLTEDDEKNENDLVDSLDLQTAKK